MLSSQKEGPSPQKYVKPDINNTNKWYALYEEKFGSPSRRSTNTNLSRLPRHHRPPPSELVSLLSNREKGFAKISGPNELQKRARSSMKGNDFSSIVLPLTFKRIPSYDEERRRNPVRVLGGSGGYRDGKSGIGRSMSSKNVNNITRRRGRNITGDDDDIYVPTSRAYGSGEPSTGRNLPAAGKPSGNLATTGSSAAQGFGSPPSHQADLLRGAAQGRRQYTSGTLPVAPKPLSEEKNTGRKSPPTRTPSGSSNAPKFSYSNIVSGRQAAPSAAPPREESSSQSSNDSLGNAPGNSASQRDRLVPPEDESKNHDDNSSGSSSREISHSSLDSRLSEMKLIDSDPMYQQPVDDYPLLSAGSTKSKRRASNSTSFSRAGSTLAGGLQNYSGGSVWNSNQYTSRDVRGLVGLINEGNTCYLNSCLQCLAHTMPLAFDVQGPLESLVVQIKGKGGRAGTSETDFSSVAELLAYAFKQVLRDLWQRPAFSATSARTILQCIQAWAPQFAGHAQHDAQEVLRAILDGLHEAFNRVTTAPPYQDLYLEPKPEEELAELTWRYHKSSQDSIIEDIFCGQLQSTIECCTCHRKSHCFDPFLDLSLPLPKNERENSMRDSFRGGNSRPMVTLQDCLTAFVTPEQLEGSNKYYCPGCKRFYRTERLSYQKDETPVYYPLQGLDFTDFLSARANQVRRGEVVYDLYSVCCHMGSLGCGHYTAQCKNCENDMWYCFNDSSVSPIQDAAVLSSSAYILFYQKRS